MLEETRQPDSSVDNDELLGSFKRCLCLRRMGGSSHCSRRMCRTRNPAGSVAKTPPLDPLKTRGGHETSTPGWLRYTPMFLTMCLPLSLRSHALVRALSKHRQSVARDVNDVTMTWYFVATSEETTYLNTNNLRVEVVMAFALSYGFLSTRVSGDPLGPDRQLCAITARVLH
jgi:hypothetical protein